MLIIKRVQGSFKTIKTMTYISTVEGHLGLYEFLLLILKIPFLFSAILSLSILKHFSVYYVAYSIKYYIHYLW